MGILVAKVNESVGLCPNPLPRCGEAKYTRIFLVLGTTLNQSHLVLWSILGAKLSFFKDKVGFAKLILISIFPVFVYFRCEIEM